MFSLSLVYRLAEARSPKPDLNPYTLNLKPYTLNLKPATRSLTHLQEKHLGLFLPFDKQRLVVQLHLALGTGWGSRFSQLRAQA